MNGQAARSFWRAMTDTHNLSRFEQAQAPVYDQVLAELHAGRKRSHWMWFIFPQIAGLGLSATSRHYAIASLDEARAYLAHAVLGPRLLACTDTVCVHRDVPALSIFGSPDDAKFRSSMTLFAQVETRFEAALTVFFAGRADGLTLEILGKKGLLF